MPKKQKKRLAVRRAKKAKPMQAATRKRQKSKAPVRSRQKHLSEACSLLAEFVHSKFGSYVAAAEDLERLTGLRPPKASISHWIVGAHKPNAQASDALHQWAGIPIGAWYREP